MGWAANTAKSGLASLSRSVNPQRLYRAFSYTNQEGFAKFRPTRSIQFDKRGSSVIAYTRIKGYYLFCLLVGGGISLVALKALHGLYHYKELGWFRRIFWFCLALGCGFAAVSLHSATREVITKVWLKSCGRQVQIRRGFAFMPRETVFIRDLARVEGDQLQGAGAMLLVGYPVMVKGQQMILPKTMERVRQDLFGAVFNGMEIDLDEPPNEIIIE